MSELANIAFPGVAVPPADSYNMTAAGAGTLGVGGSSLSSSSMLAGLAPALASGAISGLIGLGQSELNYKNQQKLNKQMYKINKKLAEQAFDRNVQMWKMQTEYNTPTEQVARLRAAGVNPAIAFGSGNMTGNAEAAPELAYSEYNPKVPLFDFGSPVSSAISGFQASLQARDIQSRIEERESNVLRNYASAAKTGKDTEFLSKSMQSRVLNWELQNTTLTKGLDLIQNRIAESSLDQETKIRYLMNCQEIYDLQKEGYFLGNMKTEHEVVYIDNSAKKLLNEAVSIAESLAPQISLLRSESYLNTQRGLDLVYERLNILPLRIKQLNEKISETMSKTMLNNKQSWYYVYSHAPTFAKALGLGGPADNLFSNVQWIYIGPGTDHLGDASVRHPGKFGSGNGSSFTW